MTFTKALIPAALAATVGTAALAENSFLYQEADQMLPASTIMINGVTAEADGVVAIYDYSTGEYGDLLGMEAVFAGANSDVNVELQVPAVSDVVAVLYEGGVKAPAMGVAMLEIELES
ncbi:DUF7282 domain-containing protein [Flavimaricola marinus]|uniref:DUF7282 domain-containing protein n=1 Tax=Flavimaricola marinus TaxID=1819565 RepID=A0A238LJU0_9RHOB|nr:hypothetical protein [Flavimaricola marinus]SMY09655.1 hypothetical protein LOM8899_03827 [Flavimaricola marinus]